MNKIYSFIATAAVAAALTACDNYDDRYTPEYASVVRLEQYGEHDIVAWTINDTEKYTINVLRSGHNINQVSTAILRVMTDDEWASYAATYGLGRYYKIPGDCFSFPGGESDCSKIVFEPKQIAGEAEVNLLSGKLSALSKTLPEAAPGEDNVFCLPILLETDNGSVLPAQNTLLLKVVSMNASLTLSSTGFEKVSCTSSSSPIVRDYVISLSCDNPWGFTVKLSNDAQLLEEYNAENNSRYTLIGSNALEVLDNETWKPWEDCVVNFPEGINSRAVTVRIDPSKVGLMDVLALRVSEPSLSIATDPAKLSSIFAVQVKPSTQRIKVAATDISSSTDDGTHTAKNLVDGKRNTYFTTNPDIHDGDPVYGSYVDMILPSPIRYFAFDYMSRFDYFGSGDGIPNEVDIYASTDGTNWEKCGEIKNMRREFTKMSQTETFGNFDAGKEVKYIRWAVIMGGASGHVDHREAATTAHWSATALYIYGK